MKKALVTAALAAVTLIGIGSASTAHAEVDAGRMQASTAKADPPSGDWSLPAAALGGSDSSGTHSYQSTCEAGLPRFTNTSDPSSTGNGVIEFRAAGAALTLSPGESGVLNPGEVSPNTPWDVVFFDLGEPYVFDGGTLGTASRRRCRSPTRCQSLKAATTANLW